jgi:transcription initiation factor TFIIB
MVLKIFQSSFGCKRCSKNSMMTDNVTGEKFCVSCGYVDSSVIVDSGQEWRSFTDDARNRARTGSPISLTMHDMGLSTVINPINRDATGKPLTTSMKSTIKRLRTWDSRSQTHESSDRNMRQAFTELDKLKDKLSLSDSIVETAAYIYRKAIEKKLVRGRSITAMISSALYAACRDSNIPRTIKDVALASNIKKKDIARCYRLLVNELGLKMPVANSIRCIARIANNIDISEKTKRYAIQMLKIAQKNKESAGKDPMGLAAAALYFSCVKNGEDKTQRDVAMAANVTEVTIRNRYKGLKEQ